MERAVPRRNRFALWYERTRRPGRVVAALGLLLYAPSLRLDFMADDHRALRVMGECREGRRPRPAVYEFLAGDATNARLRVAGWYPWWMDDTLRYRHLRPLSEWALYAQYRVFGERALGYRLIGLALYAAGVLVVLRLLRLVGGDERAARWGALVFAVAACHAIPVIFIAAQCDLWALVAAGGAMLLAGRYVQAGGAARLAGAGALYAAGLFAKEAVFPAAVLPAVFGWAFREDLAARRRAATATAALALMATVWLACYVRGGYGSNTSLMLDPLHDPLGYLRSAPLRALLLLATWLIPINPFLFELQGGGTAYLWAYALAGGAGLAAIAAMFAVHHRRQRGVVEMAVWTLLFLPVLVCTPPDDRVMVLPSIGLAFLAAAWMTRPRESGSWRLRPLPVALFVAVQIVTALATTGVFELFESGARRNLRSMAEGFGRPVRADDHIFVLNSAHSFEGLFMQDRLRRLAGLQALSAAVLSDVAAPCIHRLDAHTLRIEATSEPLLSSFLGRMGTARSRVRREGERIAAGEFEVTVVRAEGGMLREVDVRFRRPITDDAYRFYLVEDGRPPSPYTTWEHRERPRGQ